MIGLVMATRLEAQPFIDRLCLSRVEDGLFPVYAHGEVSLIITGIGKSNAVMACTYFIMRHDPRIICNAGAAGALDKGLALGTCLQASRIVEPDRPDLRTGLPRTHELQCLPGIETATLATLDRPVLHAGDRDALSRLAHIADMEGAGISQVSRRFGRRCLLVKFVSDTREHGDIEGNILKLRQDFSSFFIDEVFSGLVRDAHHPSLPAF